MSDTRTSLLNTEQKRYGSDSSSEGTPINSVDEKKVGIDGFRKLPDALLTNISSFLPTPASKGAPPDTAHILKSVSTDFSEDKYRYAKRWAAKAYNKSYLFPTFDGFDRDGFPVGRCEFGPGWDGRTFPISPIRSNHLIKDNAANCGQAVFSTLCPCGLCAICTAPQLANHIVSTLCCGIGFFAGKVKDTCGTQPTIDLLSPEEARKIKPPVTQVMI